MVPMISATFCELWSISFIVPITADDRRAARRSRRVAGACLRLDRMIGVLLHGGRQLLHARGRLLQRRRLLLGTLRQVVLPAAI
jgi:hypothetical protein